MADGTEKAKKETEDKAPAAPAKGNKKILIIAIAAVAVLGIGAGAFLFLKGKPAGNASAEAPKDEAAADGAHGGEAKGSQEEAKGGHGEAKGGHGEAKKAGASDLFALDPFIVNLQDNSGTRYLKLTLSLEVDGPQEEINAQSVRIRDSLIVLLSSKSYSDIGTVDGKYQLRDEIVSRVNQFLTKTKVKSVYFSDMVIQ